LELLKLHNKFCEKWNVFSNEKRREINEKILQNINYKQNVSKKIVCKSITF
jgi:hypothetical protein